FFSSRRRHTRSLRDWSSDVCSSDLGLVQPAAREINQQALKIAERAGRRRRLQRTFDQVVGPGSFDKKVATPPAAVRVTVIRQPRSEERRVGKECRSRGSVYE